METKPEEMASSPRIPPWGRSDTVSVAGLIALSFALRLLLALLAPIIGDDSGRHIEFAREILAGDWDTSLSEGLSPGYPLSVAVFSWITGEVGVAAYAVSVIFSSLAILPFYILIRDMAGRRAARLASLLVICLPRIAFIQSDAMTDGLFQSLFIASLCLGWFGVTRASTLCCLLSGAVGALAYHTRIEGLYLPVALGGLAVLAILGAWWRAKPLRSVRLLQAGGGVLVFVILISPMLVWIHSKTGSWHVGYRPSFQAALTAISSNSNTGSASPRSGWVHALWLYQRRLVQSGFFIVPFIGLLGLALVRRRMKLLGAAFAVCVILGYSSGLLLAATVGYPLSYRYVVIPVIFMTPFAAVAIITIVDYLRERTGSVHPPRAASVVLGVLLCFMAVRSAYNTWTNNSDKVPLKTASRWLRERIGDETVYWSNSNRFWYYMGRRSRRLPQYTEGLRKMRLHAGEYVMVYEEKYREFVPKWERILNRRLKRIARFPERESKGVYHVSVYQKE